MSEPVVSIRTPMRLEYTYTAGEAQSLFLRGIAEGRIVGRRCPQCSRVYVPPRGLCQTCAVPTGDEVEVADRGTVTTFCIVNVPFHGQVLEIPYVYAQVLLDGADTPLAHLIQEIPAAEVRIGLRVQAVWVPTGEMGPTLESIRYFKPTGEPDAAEAVEAYV